MTVRCPRDGGKRIRGRHAPGFLIAALLLIPSRGPLAAVGDVAACDVTPKTFSVIWSVDEAVISATLHVYDDAAGTTELTGGLSVAENATAATRALGLTRVEVGGVAASTCYYVATETTTAAGTEVYPAAPPFIEVCSAAASVKVNAANQPIANDLILHDLTAPDGVTPTDGALVLVSTPGLGAEPVCAVVGSGIAAPRVVADLNDLYAASDGLSLELAGDEVLQITEYRGLLCPAAQSRVRYARAPAHEEVPTSGAPISQAELPAPCFFADTLCDDTIDILDAQRVLNAFGAQSGECAFNPDLDIVADQVINVLDVQSVLNRFGESAPFGP